MYTREYILSAESDLQGLCWHSVSRRQLGGKEAAVACQDWVCWHPSPNFCALFSSSFISSMHPSLIAAPFFTSRVNEEQPNGKAWDWANTGWTSTWGSYDCLLNRLGAERQYYTKLGGKHHLFLLNRGNMSRCKLFFLSRSHTWYL